MTSILDGVKAVLSSPHTSIPGLVIGLCMLGEIWLPQYEDKFHKTREAMTAYGLLAAAQIGRKNGNGNGKPEEPKQP